MAKSTKPANKFSAENLQNWDASDGVNFAIALARITGWLLHVHWWTPSDNKQPLENMKSLRVYVANNANQVFDLTGKFTITTFTINVIEPLIKKRFSNLGGVVTRFYRKLIFLLCLYV